MKKIFSINLFLFFLLCTNSFTQAQIVKGKLIDQNGLALREVSVYLYISPDIYNTTSDTAGSFSFSVVTNIEEEGQLPAGYSITNYFPNPFNPKTRIGITLPTQGNVKVGVYNILGQRVIDEIDRDFSSGTHSIDIELEGLSSGLYIARISIDEKFTAVKMMMLIYGSQHLSSTGGSFINQLPKSNSNSLLLKEIDSLVATSSIIGRKTFTTLPSISGDTLDLGELTIERFCPGLSTVTYEGKTYNTVQIGNQCWLKENLDAGTMIPGSQNQGSGNGIEKYCYNDDPNNCSTYGGLYQWNEAMQYVTTEGTQGICPTGWHIPTLVEIETLATTVNNDGNSLKAIGQGTGGGAGTNTSGFSALLAGIRGYDGYFYDLGIIAYFWSSTEYGIDDAYYLYLLYSDSLIVLFDSGRGYGFSVRCLKD